jgi:hypothetical protein
VQLLRSKFCNIGCGAGRQTVPVRALLTGGCLSAVGPPLCLRPPLLWPPTAGSFVDTIWRKVEVGQIVRVDDEELFPADLLCLRSALPDDVCFIRTTNLDGETNLKVRR